MDMLRESPRFGVFGFSVLITEGVSDLYNFSCTQMSKRFRVPLWHVAPTTDRKGNANKLFELENPESAEGSSEYTSIS